MDKIPIEAMIRKLEKVLPPIETQIMLTPTSQQRNELCDANIHINAAIACLRKALDE